SFSLASRCSLFCHELWFLLSVFYFLFNDSSTTEIYTLSLHDALPILLERERPLGDDRRVKSRARAVLAAACSIHFVHDGFSDILDRKSTRLNSSHVSISYAVFCLKKKNLHDPALHRVGAR